MADYKVHLSQAKHNEDVANRLVQEPPFHDWGITVAFYAAIHYLECWLFNKPERHTETSIPRGSDGKLQFTPHAWREKLVERGLNKSTFKSYRKLRDSSETARYLSLYRGGWLNEPASDYFRPEDANDMVKKDLINIKKELGISL